MRSVPGRCCTLRSILDESGHPDSAAESTDTSALAELRRLDQRLRETEERLAAVEDSTSYRLGHSLVAAARTPIRIGRLRRELRRAWHSRVGPPAPRPHRAAGLPPAAPWRTVPSSRGRLVIAGVLRDETAATIEPDAAVFRIGPADGPAALEHADPDLVLVETGAFGAGRPWAYTGDPAATEREGQLLALLAAARAAGRPTVLWWTAATPEPIGIVPLAGRFDLELAAPSSAEGSPWDPGVQLARFNPLDLDPARSAAPLFLGAWPERRAGPTRDLLEALLLAAAAAHLEILVDAHDLGGPEAFPAALQGCIRGRRETAFAADLYRARAVVIGDPFATGDGLRPALEALACGSRVVALPVAGLAEVGGAAVATMRDAAEAASTLTGALERGARADSDVRSVLRTIFLRHAAPIRLAELTGRLGLALDPLGTRRVAVLAPIAGADDPSQLVESVLRQRLAPAELVVTGEAAARLDGRARSALETAGIALHGTDGQASARVWMSLAAGAATGWVAPWAGNAQDPSHLLDLVLAGECSRADAVGFAATESWCFVDDLELGRSIVRRELIVDDARFDARDADEGRLRIAARRGARLFGVPQPADQHGAA